MTKDELEVAKQPAEVEKLLDRVDTLVTTDYQATAYNTLIEYLENPEWFSSREGGLLILLSLEVLRGIT